MITATLPPHNLNLFQARRASFQSHCSPLNPTTRPASCSAQTLTKRASPADSTQTHLSNLEKLLHSKDPPAPAPAPSPGSPESGKPARPGPLEGLNLAKLWPAVKAAAAEEVSPCHLKRLQRLLLMTPEYSPRNNLGGRWPEYHGSRDWAGLLDPLDENLRREVVRYGELVQAAYQSFHGDPALPPEAAPAERQVPLSHGSFKVTRSLYATSSVGLPGWVDDVAPDLGWMTQRSSWIGYVAVCEDKREIARMGRRDIVIALRGTATCLEWAENFRSALVPLPGPDETAEAQDQAQAQIQPKVGCGFLSLHKTPGAHVPSLAQSVVDEVRRLVSHYEGEALSITITGHSLGAALALLVADELTENIPDSLPPVAVLSFGGPRVGNRGFANRITAKNVKVLRIVNNQDMITRVPGIFMSEGLNQKLKEAGMDEHMLLPWAYSHVGTELRVDTKMSPFLRPDADVACCHDLEAYLHLVDGFSASDCPFRANAKRSLVKLLHEQGSNVKKLYTSKAKALKLDIEKDVRRPIYGCLPSPS